MKATLSTGDGCMLTTMTNDHVCTDYKIQGYLTYEKKVRNPVRDGRCGETSPLQHCLQLYQVLRRH